MDTDEERKRKGESGTKVLEEVRIKETTNKIGKKEPHEIMIKMMIKSMEEIK